MSTQLKIFITGATGYIGGSVLSRLLNHNDASSFQITALVRSEEKANKLKTLGINVIVGSYTDPDLNFLTREAAQSDIVITIADADLLPPTQAILRGLKIRYEKSGKAPILMHTVCLLLDDARGLTSEGITYSDMDVEKLNAFPESVLHRNVDIPIQEADKAGYVKAYLVAPSTVIGRPSGPLVDLGIQNTHSLLFNLVIKPALGRKKGGYFGKGVNSWVSITLKENFYIILFDAVRKNPEITGHGFEGYYFPESSRFSFEELARAISESLVEAGVGDSKEPSVFTQEEVDTLYGPVWRLLATNVYANGERARALGWKSTSNKADFLASVKEEVKEYLKESK
ncbi:hypothetical protein CVT25_009319 [Psilocybe cyanescens]|uniref:NmrA-like domain-containing protein n=1 Tax=Psilocybe cyanescens TaxID=93625 RepID=A0A409VN87_PSICY|nr:hypothetical protein CVT25_009319 [Psilocybe cyanescens]